MKKILLSLIAFLPFFASAQKGPAAYIHNQVWTQLNTKVTVSDEWSFMNELHVRRVNYLKDQQQLIIRPSINYKVNNMLILTAGYSFIQNEPYGLSDLNISTNEHNVWEQAILKHNLGALSFQHRYRWEHRFVDNVIAQGTEGFEKDGLKKLQRFRYRISATLPLADFENESGIYVHAFDELFVNSTFGLGLYNFNQNWMYIGMGYRFNKAAKAQLGYKKQILRIEDSVYEKNSTIYLTLSYDFDLRKKKS